MLWETAIGNLFTMFSYHGDIELEYFFYFAKKKKSFTVELPMCFCSEHACPTFYAPSFARFTTGSAVENLCSSLQISVANLLH